MVRRFVKKVKNDGLLDEARARRMYTKPSELRRQKKAAVRKLIEKVNKQRDSLFNPGDRKVPRNRRSKK
jgi:ribosomal protein S21